MSKSFRKDLTGQRFGKLTVIESAGKGKDGRALLKCVCDCGNEVTIREKNLKRGNTKSCGCLKLEKLLKRTVKHGLHDTLLYGVWESMKNRCYNSNGKEYKNYGGRGIRVCDEWRNNFKIFYDWAMTNGYAENLSIDRKDVDGNYSPSNCRWVSMEIQENNKRNNYNITYNGKTQTLSQWAKELEIPPSTLRNRIKVLNWPVEKAFKK